MMRSLHARLVAVLLGLLLGLGAILIAINFYSTRRYEEEVVQRLNRALASSLVAEDAAAGQRRGQRTGAGARLPHPDGHQPEHRGLSARSRGQRGAALDANRVGCCATTIDIEPIKAFLAADAELPILGDDPLDEGRRKVFSASAIMVEDRYEGYLYVVLASEAYESVVNRLQGQPHSAAQRDRNRPRPAASRPSQAWCCSPTSPAGCGRSPASWTFSGGAISRRRCGSKSDPAAVMRSTPLTETFEGMSERIIQQVRTLKQTDELRRELVANVSHDLRTPLASLTGYIETLQLKEGRLTDEERDQYLAVARRQSDRLATLVEELFELARLESRDMEPELEPFPLPELVQDVVSGIPARGRRRRRSASISNAHPTSHCVSADIGLIQRALSNLIGNALKHTEEGGRVSVFIEPLIDKVAVRNRGHRLRYPRRRARADLRSLLPGTKPRRDTVHRRRFGTGHRQADSRTPRLRRRGRKHRRRGHCLYFFTPNGVGTSHPRSRTAKTQRTQSHRSLIRRAHGGGKRDATRKPKLARMDIGAAGNRLTQADSVTTQPIGL